MSIFALSALIAGLATAALLGPLIRLARSRGIFTPAIRPRDVHSTPIPRVGGLAMVATFLGVVLLIQIFRPEYLVFSNQSIFGIDKNLLGLILGILILSVVNLRDDLRELPWQVKLTAQVAAALVIAFFGVRIELISSPFGPDFVLGQLSWLFVVVWLVVISNVVNWLDSIDGVAGGVSAISLAMLFFLSIAPHVNQGANALLAAIGFGTAIGFLFFNLRGQAFLGDTGSMFLGFLIGVLAIISGGKVATVFLVMAIPFLDALVVFTRRLLAHKSPFLPDRYHLIHRLMDRGWEKSQIIGLYYAFSLGFGLIALNTQTIGKAWAAVAAVVLMAFLIGMVTIRKIRQSQTEKTEK